MKLFLRPACRIAPLRTTRVISPQKRVILVTRLGPIEKKSFTKKLRFRVTANKRRGGFDDRAKPFHVAYFEAQILVLCTPVFEISLCYRTVKEKVIERAFDRSCHNLPVGTALCS